MHQKLDGMVQMGLQNQMLSFSTAMKIYNSPSMREVQRMIEKSEADMNNNQAKQADEARKTQERQIEANKQQYEAEIERDQRNFERTDDTKRYIAELQAETDRLKEVNKDVVPTEDDSNDEADYAKFQEEMNFKQHQEKNKMKQHNDQMAMKEKELQVKKSKPASK